MKRCTKCGVEKEEGCFYKMKASKDGLTCWCKDCANKYHKELYSIPKVRALRLQQIRERQNRPEIKERRKQQAKEWYTRPGIKERKGDQQRNRLSSSEAKVLRNKKHANKRNENLLLKITLRLRGLVSSSLKHQGYSKKSKTRQLLGADYETVRKHLEDTWFQNYGTIYEGQKVHIDHIIPCASAKTEEELIALQHYTNLQYLTPEDNLAKSDRILI